MKTKLLVITLITAALIVFFLLSNKGPIGTKDAVIGPTEQALTVEDQAQLKSIQNEKAAAVQLKEAYSDQNSAAQNALDRYQYAITEREAAEAQLRALEREVEELENEIDIIEQRGDDPADFQADSLEGFQTLLGKFEDAIQRLDEAELAEAESLRLLELSKQELEALPE